MTMFKKPDYKQSAADQLTGYERPEFHSSDTSGVPRAKQDRQFRQVPIEAIIVRKQIRETFEDIEELADSIRTHGLLDPCIVWESQEEGGYILVVGERRYKAAKLAELQTISCKVLDHEPSEEEHHEIQLIENVQRKDLKPLEEARGYQRFVDDFGYSQPQIAKRTGKAQSTISRALSLFKLPEDLQAKVGTDELPVTLAYTLAKIKPEDQQREMLERFREGEVNARNAGQKTRSPKRTTAAKERTRRANGIDAKAKLKKAHTNTEFAVFLAEWIHDIAKDNRSQLELDSVTTAVQQVLTTLHERAEAAECQAA